MATRSK